MSPIFALIVAVGAYLIGSVPSGYLLGLARGIDLRKEGSGNIGATNALRVLGKKWGYVVFVADILKGWLSVTLAQVLAFVYAPEKVAVTSILAALFAVIGHNFPVWLRFQGGKGIATSAGVMLALFPVWVFLCALVVWVAFFYSTRYVSVASIAAAISFPLSTIILAFNRRCDWLLVPVAILMCALAVWRHKANIQRLFAGTEKKFKRNRY